MWVRFNLIAVNYYPFIGLNFGNLIKVYFNLLIKSVPFRVSEWTEFPDRLFQFSVEIEMESRPSAVGVFLIDQ